LVLRFARWKYGIGLGACGEDVSCFDGILILPGTAASSDLGWFGKKSTRSLEELFQGQRRKKYFV
jgi:hypothetical protein